MEEAARAERSAAMHARLLELVRCGEEGSRLPPERQLARELGVARMTLRRAVDRLVAAGLITRQQGRGAFVTRPRLARQLAMTSFSEEMRRRGMVPSSDVLDVRRVRANPLQAQSLRIPVNDPIFRFRRIRLADGEPMGLETTCTPLDLVPELTAADLAGSWYDLLENVHGYYIVGGNTIIEPTMPSKREAALLRTPGPRPAFRLEGVSLLASGRVIEHCTSLFRGDRYQLTVELSPLPDRDADIRRLLGSATTRTTRAERDHRPERSRPNTSQRRETRYHA